FGICFWGLSLAALDGDLARPGRLVLRQRDVQHAVVEAGLDLVGVHRERQGQHAGEAAERPLLAVADALLRDHRLALALEGQLVAARDEDLQVIQVQSGKLGLDVDGLGLLPDVDRRAPRGQAQEAPAVPAPAVEQTVHLTLQLLELVPDGAAKLLPTRRPHVSTSFDGYGSTEIAPIGSIGWAKGRSGSSC